MLIFNFLQLDNVSLHGYIIFVHPFSGYMIQFCSKQVASFEKYFFYNCNYNFCIQLVYFSFGIINILVNIYINKYIDI